MAIVWIQMEINFSIYDECTLKVWVLYEWTQVLSTSCYEYIWVLQIVYSSTMSMSTGVHRPQPCLILLWEGHHHGLTGRTLDQRSPSPEFEPQSGHIWRVFYLWLCFITFGHRLAHLAYHAHKIGRKTSIVINLTFEAVFF